MNKAAAFLTILMVPGTVLAQAPPAEAPPQPQAPLLSPQQLDNLVAPIALYPDPLLGQVLAASTYPLEIVEAQQWLQQHPGLSGQQLIDAARQQSWDPSVEALVAFPDAMAMLTRDIQWTTDLGNAFLAQQSDVMDAIQRMRARAQQNGTLQSTSQDTVTTEPADNGQPAIQIQPANPQVVYVPQYNPVYVWGPPVYGAYPPLWYPAVSYGCGFGAGVFLGGLFSGFLGFGGWGWGLNWLAHGLFLNTLFFNHFGFGGFGPGFYGRAGVVAWAHNPAHRLGVAYPNRAVAGRFGYSAGRYAGGSNARSYSASRSYASNFGSRSYAGNYNARSYSGSNFGSRGYAGNSAARSYAAPSRSYGSNFSERGGNYGARSYSAPARSYGSNFGSRDHSNSFANRGYSARSYAPSNRGERSFSRGGRSSAPRSQHFSAPRSSGGHSGGHSGGGHRR